MSPSSDKSPFIAALFGEGTPADEAHLTAALAEDPVLRREAESLRQTARRLGAALKQEPSLKLTPAQRTTVLTSAPGITPSPASVVVRKVVRPAWWGPTLATAGIAAGIAVASLIFLVPGRSTPRASASAPEAQVIPAVGIQPAAAAPEIRKPVPPLPPGLTAGPGLPGTIPNAAGPQSPVTLPPAGSMAATPPVLEVPPVPPSRPELPLKPGSPGRSSPGKLRPGEALGSGAPR